MMAMTTAPVIAVDSAIPTAPGGHGMLAPGRPSIVRAVPPIALAHTHEIHANGSAMMGNPAVMRATSPETVAIGTSGATRMFARIP